MTFGCNALTYLRDPELTLVRSIVTTYRSQLRLPLEQPPPLGKLLAGTRALAG